MCRSTNEVQAAHIGTVVVRSPQRVEWIVRRQPVECATQSESGNQGIDRAPAYTREGRGQELILLQTLLKKGAFLTQRRRGAEKIELALDIL